MRTLLTLALCLPLAAVVDEDYQNPGVSGKPDNYQPPMYGVEMTPPPSSVLQRENLGANQGVLVQQVYPDTAASVAGIQPGDVIISMNGNPIGSMTDLRNQVGISQVGDQVGVVVSRNGQQLELGSQFKPWPESIPHRPIDAAAEARFREWQQERIQRETARTADLGRRADEAARKLDDALAADDSTAAAGAAAGAAGEQVPGAPRTGPDSPTSWVVRRDIERLSPGVAVARPAAATGDGPAFRIRFPAAPSL